MDSSVIGIGLLIIWTLAIILSRFFSFMRGTEREINILLGMIGITMVILWAIDIGIDLEWIR